MTSEARASGGGAGHGTASTKGGSGTDQKSIENMRMVAERYDAVLDDNGHCGEGLFESQQRKLELARATTEFGRTFTPLAILSLLNENTRLQGEKERLEEALSGFGKALEHIDSADWAYLGRVLRDAKRHPEDHETGIWLIAARELEQAAIRANQAKGMTPVREG